MKPRPHEGLIKAWAEGAEIQVKCCGDGGYTWSDLETPAWHEDSEYRIKPKNKVYYATLRKLEAYAPPVICSIYQAAGGQPIPAGYALNKPNLKLVMDSEGKLISAEVI